MTFSHKNSHYFGPKLGGIATKLSLYARKRMFRVLMQMAAPTADTKVLDVGVTCDPREDSNFFEKLYPYSDKITAVGLEDAYFLEQEYPGLKFVKASALNLPFPDNSFDLVVSFAVIEHVGSRSQQLAAVSEMCRVGKACFITTPNRWYPIEFHTVLPLVHWLPKSWFRTILKWLGKDFWAKEENLNLLSEKNMLNLIPTDKKVYKKHFRLFGLISNLVFYLD